MEEFYLHLPSNTLTNSHVNTVNNYLTTFSDTLELGRNWQVGLTAISYTYSWYNVKPGSYISIKSFNGDRSTAVRLDQLYKIPEVGTEYSLAWPINTGFKPLERKDYEPLRDFKPRAVYLATFELTPGHYSTIEKLIAQINEQTYVAYERMAGADKWVPRLEYIPQLGRIRSISGRVIYHKDGGKKYIQQTFICTSHPELAQMLGTPEVYNIWDMPGIVRLYGNIMLEDATPKPEIKFPPDELINVVTGSEDTDFLIDSQYSFLFPDVFDMRVGIRALCVYCDMVDLTIVGDRRVNLLRAVPIPNNAKFMDQIDMEFMHVHYLPVPQTELRNVQVNIKDESGSDIEFEAGRVILTLQFKRSKAPVKGLSNE